MAAGGRHINVSSVGFTPFVGGSLGTLIPIPGITTVGYDDNAQIIDASADADIGPSSKNMVRLDPTFTVNLDRIAGLVGIRPGMKGVFTCTENDNDNGSATGALIHTLAYAMVGNRTTSSKHRDYANGTVAFSSYWPDGVTNPHSITVQA